MSDSTRIAEDLRAAVGRLVREVRLVDTVPPGEEAILGYLDRDGAHTIAQLARRRAVSHQSAARTVQQLIAQGLVTTEPHATDGRKLLVSLLPEGRRLLDVERDRRADRLAAAIDDALTEAEHDDLRHCIDLLTRLADHLHRP